MVRNYVAASLRNLARNKLHAAIIVAGLAAALAAAMLIALFVRDEFSYDSWLPLHERTYVLRTALEGNEAYAVDRSPYYFAATMKLDFPQIEASARMTPGRASIRAGQVEYNEDTENFYWADPNIFDVLRLPAVAGDPLTALQSPDGVVMTRRIARKYFGQDDPIGETVTFDRQHSMTVTAVLEDLPSNTHLRFDIVASGRAAFSNLARMDQVPAAGFLINCFTYLRLVPGASAGDVEPAMPDFMTQHNLPPIRSPGFAPRMLLTPLAAVHLAPGADPFAKPHGHREAIFSVAAVGVLIVLIACINFVNLITARSVHRAKEVGIRKVAGAARSDVVHQFIGEALIYMALSAVLALAIVEFLLPELNALMDRSIVFDWWNRGAFVALLCGFILLMGILAGAYPAFVLSAFRPATVLRSGVVQASGSNTVRRMLVILQFATLIGLILATTVIYRQTQFALNEGMRLDRDQVYLIRTDCRDAFKDEVAALPGVRGVACSSAIALNFGNIGGAMRLPDGTGVTASRHEVDFGFFEFYGLRPLAGRFFSRDHVGDAAPITDQEEQGSTPIVINEAAVRTFKLESPSAALGATIWPERYARSQAHVIGVVPDFSVDSIHGQVPPTVYFLDQGASVFLSVRLSGRDIPETLENISRLWNKMERAGPVNSIFLERHVQDLYRDVTQQGLLFAAFAGTALFIACTGLFGLSAYSAARRTKEIGMRKAMGATTTDVVRLLGWEFAKPVLWANLIAWPAAYYVMNRWLNGFAYHIDLAPWMFFAAGALALSIALATVAGHSVLVARAKPVTALRYE